MVDAEGYDFYALDLRKYGRSLLPHQTPNFVTDLATYYEEIDAAWQRITERDDHTEVTISAHSTGGLIAPLWAHDRQPAALHAMVLNSPWFDLQGSPLLRVVGTPVIKQIGSRRPKLHVKRQVSGVYARSLHRDHEGEWDFDLDLKPLSSFPVYAGWLKAIRDGHARLHAGLQVPAPVLVLSSDQTRWTAHMNEAAHTADLVLDVGQIRRWATAVGPDVTYKAVAGAARRDPVAARRPGRGLRDDHSVAEGLGGLTFWITEPRPLSASPTSDGMIQSLFESPRAIVGSICRYW